MGCRIRWRCISAAMQTRHGVQTAGTVTVGTSHVLLAEGSSELIIVISNLFWGRLPVVNRGLAAASPRRVRSPCS